MVRAVERGADLFVFAPHGHAPDLTLVGAPDVRTIADLRGRTIAVDGARTGYALLLRRLLRRNGLGDADVVFREIGGSQERFDAMKSGETAASLLNPPFDANLLAAGYISLARMNEAFPGVSGLGHGGAAELGARASRASSRLSCARSTTRTRGCRSPKTPARRSTCCPSGSRSRRGRPQPRWRSSRQRPPPQLTADGMRQ